MAEAIVRVKGLSVGYWGQDVLHDVSFELGEGEIIGLLGPNGSGKTTLLKAVCGALPASRGNVEIQGQDVRKLAAQARARLAAYVPQQEAHIYDITVLDLVLMGRLCRSDGLFETQEDVRAAENAMEETDCLRFSDRFVSTLSGGEAQRALIARALAQETPVLLCDEPTTHLDPRHQIETMNLLRRLRDAGKAVIASSHDLNWALGGCDRCVLLDRGRIAFAGDLLDACRQGILDDVYESRFIAGSIDGRPVLQPVSN
ncbi:MAG: ABC transporter ATP-binding protein [Armatimonadetes bacterium]|nr:ABC transporter ATP-binding protein [Armatimonadota bacterium]